MNFLNPWMLWGALAVAVPIIIHLLNRRRFRRVSWAAMKFLRVSVEKNQRRMRVEDLILLLLRCAMVAILALLLARPALSWMSSKLLGSRVEAVVLVDHSGSMNTVLPTGRVRLDEAVDAATEVIQGLPTGSMATLWLASDQVSGTGLEGSLDLDHAETVLSGLSPTHRGSGWFPSIDRAVAYLSERPAGRKELVVITDGQGQGWRDLQAIQQRLRELDSETRLKVVVVDGDREVENLGISDLRQVTPTAAVGETLRFLAEVTNYGKSESADVDVTLSIDEEQVGVAARLAALAPGETRSATFFAPVETVGYHRISASIGTDSYAPDNKRTILVRAVDKVRVVIVDGDPGDAPRDAESFFLRNAFAPVPEEEAASYYVNVRVVAAGELQDGVLDEAEVLVLANVGELPEASRILVADWVRGGGGLMVFPGDKLRAEKPGEALPLLVAEYGVARTHDPPLTLEEIPFHQTMELKPVEPAVVTSRFSSGDPAVVEGDVGLGRALIFASSADTDWNLLPARPEFLPWILKSLGTLLDRRDAGLNVPVGSVFSRPLADDTLGKEAVVYSMSAGRSAGGLQVVQELQGVPTLQWEKTDLSGAYEAAINNPPTVISFAAQADPGESELAPLSENQRERLSESADLVEWTDAVALRNELAEGRPGTELWMILLGLLLFLAVVEMFLAQRFSRAK